MNKLLIAALMLVSCWRSAGVSPAPEAGWKPALLRDLSAVRQQLAIPGLSVAVAIDDRIVLAEGLGQADVEARTPATADTLYPIGSITKTFTSTLMLQLVEEGRLDLEQPVAKYVDWEVAPDIRIRHVLSHTSEGKPGTRFVYSSRFNWLDNVVEAATKENFKQLLTTNVLQRAGLSRTFPGDQAEGYAETLAGLAKPYNAAGRSRYPPMAIHSSSGLSSTVIDLARYSIALDDGRLLSEAARERAWALSGFPYGLGWYTQTVGGERVVWHTSWWPDAYSGLLVKVPSKRLTFVVLANTDALTAPQRGASNVLLYPAARAFLERFLDVPKDFEISDDDRLKLYNDTAAGARLLAKFPEDDALRFDLALAHGNVRPTLRINGPESARAVTLLEEILASPRPRPRFMDPWSNYLIAEHIAPTNPTRARALLQKTIESGVDTDALQSRAATLLKSLPPPSDN